MDDDVVKWLQKNTKENKDSFVRDLSEKQADMSMEMCVYLGAVKMGTKELYYLFLSAQMAGIIFSTSDTIDESLNTLDKIMPMVREHLERTDRLFNKDGNN